MSDGADVNDEYLDGRTALHLARSKDKKQSQF